MPDAAFIEAVQKRVARISVSASATRGQGAGAVAAGRRFLACLPLRQFAVAREEVFQLRLDQATKRLQSALPRGTKSWGVARKLLNIFLRDALYTRYLYEHYRLGVAERHLEVPLDSITAKALRGKAGRSALPCWRGVKHLKPRTSAAYQAFAGEYAAQQNTPRVHLDTFWWGARSE